MKRIAIWPLIFVAFLSFKVFVNQVFNSDASDWRLYSAGLGFCLIALLIIYFSIKLRRKQSEG